jgi:hypothetical protein
MLLQPQNSKRRRPSTHWSVFPEEELYLNDGELEQSEPNPAATMTQRSNYIVISILTVALL